MADGKLLTLRVCAPNRAETAVECDSVHFSIPDGANGKGGGSIGIRPGHVSSLIVMAPGKLEAFLGGNNILSVETGSGFVSVSENVVTVLME